jgi:hypothetical protein
MSAYLTTDADANDRVNSFYQRAGWSLQGSWTTQQGRRMNCYSIETVETGAEVSRASDGRSARGVASRSSAR